MKLLVLLSRFPYPLDKGDKLRAYHQLVELAQRHEIVLCVMTHDHVPEAARAAMAPHCSRIEVVELSLAEAGLGIAKAAFDGRPLQVGYFDSGRARARLARLVAETRPDRALCQLVRVGEYARLLEMPLVFDFMDALSWRLEQRARHGAGLLAPLMHLEARRLARYERDLLERYADCTVVSAQDRDHMPEPAAARVAIVGNGVDFDAFRPRAAEKDVELLFVGNMAYAPNVLAAQTLVREVLPEVRRRQPARVLIAGTSPSWRVRRLRGDGVEVSGWVDDMAACYARSRVFVAPLTIGTGLQNKLLQALAMEIPCVTSELARRALGATADEMWVGRDAAEIAERAACLLADPAQARALARRGREFALARYRWPQAVAPLERMCATAEAAA